VKGSRLTALETGADCLPTYQAQPRQLRRASRSLQATGLVPAPCTVALNTDAQLHGSAPCVMAAGVHTGDSWFCQVDVPFIAWAVAIFNHPPEKPAGT